MTSLEICSAGIKSTRDGRITPSQVISQPLGSSWDGLLPESRFLASLEMTMFGVVEACLDTLHLVIARSPRRRGICCSPTFGQKQISRFARNDKGLGFVEAGLDTLLLVIPRSPEATRNLLFSNSW